jgi:hypothetical protein
MGFLIERKRRPLEFDFSAIPPTPGLNPSGLVISQFGEKSQVQKSWQTFSEQFNIFSKPLPRINCSPFCGGTQGRTLCANGSLTLPKIVV